MTYTPSVGGKVTILRVSMIRRVSPIGQCLGRAVARESTTGRYRVGRAQSVGWLRRRIMITPRRNPTILGAREDGKISLDGSWSRETSRIVDVIGATVLYIEG